jgi:type I restriction enzyme S subunit
VKAKKCRDINIETSQKTGDSEILGDSQKKWKTATLADIADTTSGGTPSRKNAAYFGGSIPWVKSGELEDNYISSTEEKITTLGLNNSAAKLFPPGTLLMAMYGATVGKTAILRIEAATNQAVCAICPKPDLAYTKYVRFALIYLRPDILMQRYGGAQPNISQQIIRNLTLPFPPLPEQRKIASLLGMVQKAIEQQQRLIALTAELKKTMLHQLFTCGLRNEPQKQTEIGLVPLSWDVVPVGDYLLEAQYGLSSKGVETGSYALLRMTNQRHGRVTSDKLQYVELAPKEFEKFKVLHHDILFNRTNSLELVGRTSIFDLDGNYVFASYLIRLRTDYQYIRPLFLNQYFNTDETQARLKSIASRAVSQSNISATRLRSFLVPKPSVAEQDEIVCVIEGINQKMDFHIRKHAILKDLFRTLLHGLMTAKISTNKIDFINIFGSINGS